MASKRIGELTEITTHVSGMVAPVYDSQNGTRKMTVANIVDNAPATFTSGDVADGDVTVSTGWTSVSKLESGANRKTLLQRVSQMMKNVRWLYKKLGTTNISALSDDGTVSGALAKFNTDLRTVEYIADCNDAMTLGKVYSTDASSANKPSGGNYWYIHVLGRTGTNSVCQLAYTINSTATKLYIRNINTAGETSGWVRVIQDGDSLAPVAVADTANAIDPYMVYSTNANTADLPDSSSAFWFVRSFARNGVNGPANVQFAVRSSSQLSNIYIKCIDGVGATQGWTKLPSPSDVAMSHINTLACPSGVGTLATNFSYRVGNVAYIHVRLTGVTCAASAEILTGMPAMKRESNSSYYFTAALVNGASISEIIGLSSYSNFTSVRPWKALSNATIDMHFSYVIAS